MEGALDYMRASIKVEVNTSRKRYYHGFNSTYRARNGQDDAAVTPSSPAIHRGANAEHGELNQPRPSSSSISRSTRRRKNGIW